MAYAFDGLVLLTNDGIFAETLASVSLRTTDSLVSVCVNVFVCNAKTVTVCKAF